MRNGWFRLAVMSFIGIVMSVLTLAIVPSIVPNAQNHSSGGHQMTDQTQQIYGMTQNPNQVYQYQPYFGIPGYGQYPVQGQMFTIPPMGYGYQNGIPYQGTMSQTMNPYLPQDYNSIKLQMDQLKLQLMQMQMQLQNNQSSSSSSMSGMSMM